MKRETSIIKYKEKQACCRFLKFKNHVPYYVEFPGGSRCKVKMQLSSLSLSLSHPTRKGRWWVMENLIKIMKNLGGATKPVQKCFWLATNFGTPMRSSNWMGVAHPFPQMH
jgi:hypothetical protein